MSERAQPFHCPYCGDENLWPHLQDDGAQESAVSQHGEWECRSCLRAFRLSMLGHLRRPAGTGQTQSNPEVER